MLRVFRAKHIMRRHLEGAVAEAATQLALALLCILLIAAGFYYELEKFGVRVLDLDQTKHDVVTGGCYDLAAALSFCISD